MCQLLSETGGGGIVLVLSVLVSLFLANNVIIDDGFTPVSGSAPSDSTCSTIFGVSAFVIARRRRRPQDHRRPLSSPHVIASTTSSPLSSLLEPKTYRPTLIILLAATNTADPDTDAPSISGSSSNDSSTTAMEGGAAADYSFFDEAIVYVRAGSGGQGSSTYKRAKKGSDGIPDGGSGGLGGNVILKLDHSLNTLAGLNPDTFRPNSFGGGGAAASSKKRGSSSTRTTKTSSTKINTLSFRAKDGTAGGRMYDNGRSGEDCEVLVPPGTVIQMEVVVVVADNNASTTTRSSSSSSSSSSDDTNRSITTTTTTFDDNDDDNDESFLQEQLEWIDVGTISNEQPTLVVAYGGRGGEGTAILKGKKSVKGAVRRRGPEGGQRGRLKLTLKIVADIALVGVPNAGKSTFLAAVTRAKPRIADYPFTTVVPNLGTWIPPNFGSNRKNGGKESSTTGTQSSTTLASKIQNNGLVLCDVPGLIAGASEGVGLGHAFLRHIERCRVILHLVDTTSEDPIGDFVMVNEELKRYGTGTLSKKPQVVVLNKIDVFALPMPVVNDNNDDDNDDDVSNTTTMTDLITNMKQAMGHTRLLTMSAKEKDGVDDLMTRMASYVGKMKEDEEEEKEDDKTRQNTVAENE